MERILERMRELQAELGGELSLVVGKRPGSLLLSWVLPERIGTDAWVSYEAIEDGAPIERALDLLAGRLREWRAEDTAPPQSSP